MIQLKKIDHDIWEAVIKLQVSEDQKDFVAPNIYSLAEAYVDSTNDYDPPFAYAICNNGEPVGFIMGNYITAESNEWDDEAIYHICRFMIDKNHQRKGHGRAGLTKMLELLKTSPIGEADAVTIGSEPENDAVRKLYDSLGFVEVNYELGDEIIARLAL